MGLIYSSSDSENLINGLRANIGSAKVALEALVSASQKLTSSIGAGKALDGSAFNAGKDLFSALIIPTIHKASAVFDDTKKHLSQYESANAKVSGEGVLDEDKLKAKKFSTEAIKAATDSTASTLRAMASAADAASSFSVASSLNEAAQSLENYSESLQQDLDKIEDKLRKLYNFNSAVNGLFNDDLNNFKLVVQSVAVLNETVVNVKTGSYTLPVGSIIEKDIFSPLGAGFIGSADKVIGIASEKGLLGERTDTIPTGFNRAMRRAYGLPKAVEEVKPLVKLREGFGVLSAVAAAGTAYEDYKNNNSTETRAGAMFIDGVATGLEYASAGTVAGVGAAAATGLVEAGAVALGVVAAPEIVVGAAAVVGAVVLVGAADWGISKGASVVKDLFHLN